MSTRDDVEEFAALLRQLKDRTDRSYGSLARRLNMNTSTLHRYCAGEAVPLDFAPVERLAAFCRASPQERLELHRLWLSAVAARQRGRTTGSAEGKAETEVKSAAEAAIPAAETAIPAPDAHRDGVEDGGANEGGDAHRDADGDGELAEDSTSADGASAPPPTPRPWYRRRRILASTTVACALLATLGIASALSDDRSSEAGADRSTGPRTTAPNAPHRSAESSSAGSAAPPPGSVSPGSRRKTPALPSAGGTSSPSAKGPVTGSPLTWSADSQVWAMGCGHDYVIDKPPAQVPPPPSQQDAGVWSATQGAVHGRQTMVRISVQGRSSTAVVLEALRVRVVSRGEPAAGNAYAMDQGCGGELTPRRFTVNLDVDRPVARPEDGANSRHTLPAVHFPYRVSAQDPEALLVDASTQAYDARWYLELDWSCQGRTGTIRIDDHGRPFRTTGIEGMPRYWYGSDEAGERAWVPYGG
ncbi:helix-turn-helix transcriptional regulator [Streptomyces sp. SID8499]|uniref:helix-turn-helix domain-containing protein n=1 Tax=Streptomyces sp. SID8499 TaxID=2706106 RepID=UPI0013C804B5|nr:helix-turn-helix domain-containing protein [Streptomyces sp. SID8499]